MEIIRRLDHNPALGKKLHGRLRGYRSARLGSSHRIIYRVSSDVTRVTAVTPRKDAYR